MKKLMWGLALAGAALAVPAAAGQGVNHAAAGRPSPRAGQNMEWPTPPANARVRVGNIDLVMANRVSGADNEILDRVLTVEAPGFPAFTIDSGEDDSFAPSVMVVETPARTPMILFQTFSGGAHCCTTINVIEPRGGRLEAVEVYQGDGGPIEEAPRDIDGDGIIDFVRYDNAFLYTFASYAESYAPPTVTNVVDGRAVDVSARPGFRSLFEDEARRAREGCLDRERGNPNGACASYVASAARTGAFDTAWREMLEAHRGDADWPLPSGCRVAAGGQPCPDADMIRYSTYPEALRAFLEDTGYLPRPR